MVLANELEVRLQIVDQRVIPGEDEAAMFAPAGPALRAFWQALAFLSRLQSPIMDLSVSGPRRSTEALAHWALASSDGVARPVHFR